MNGQKNVEINTAVKGEDYHHSEVIAAELAHEIRNPLTAIKGFLQLIKPHLKEIGKDHYADVALDEINRANDLIYDYLRLANPNTNQSNKAFLSKTIKEIAFLFEGEATLRNIQILTRLPSSEITADIPSNLFKQVIMNLTKNACEAFDGQELKERTIIISLHDFSSSVSIEIEDNGSGMNEETIKNVFSPFYSTKPQGTGIGLNICRKIIEAHGGNMSVNSTYGKGTKITVSFPR